MGILGVWLGIPLIIVLMVIALRDPAIMAETWSADRSAWEGAPLLGGTSGGGLVAEAEALRDAWAPATPSSPATRPAHLDVIAAASGEIARVGQGVWGRAWSVLQSYLPLVLVRLLVLLLAAPAILAALAGCWWGTGVAANRLREAAGAFPQAGLNKFWWRAAAVCWCAIPYGIVAPVAYGAWWLPLLAALACGTALSLHQARTHWTTTGGM